MRESRFRALHPTRPHRVGYIGVCGQEEGVVEWGARYSYGENEKKVSEAEYRASDAESQLAEINRSWTHLYDSRMFDDCLI